MYTKNITQLNIKLGFSVIHFISNFILFNFLYIANFIQLISLIYIYIYISIEILLIEKNFKRGLMVAEAVKKETIFDQ